MPRTRFAKAVGVDLRDKWSHDCILGLEGETLAEGQLRTTAAGTNSSFGPCNAELTRASKCAVRVGENERVGIVVLCPVTPFRRERRRKFLQKYQSNRTNCATRLLNRFNILPGFPGE